MTQVQGVQGGHKAVIRDARQVQGVQSGKWFTKSNRHKSFNKEIKILTILEGIHLCGNRFDLNWSYYCWLI